MRFSSAPAPVKKAAWLMIAYAAAVLIGTISFAVQTGFTETRELVRGLVRVTGFALLVWWLLSLDKRAWWVSVIACAVLCLLGILAVATFLFVGAAYQPDFLRLALQLFVPTYLLGHATFVLIQRNTRQHFERTKA